MKLYLVTVTLGPKRSARFHVCAENRMHAISLLMQSRPQFKGKHCDVLEIESCVAPEYAQ